MSTSTGHFPLSTDDHSDSDPDLSITHDTNPSRTKGRYVILVTLVSMGLLGLAVGSSSMRSASGLFRTDKTISLMAADDRKCLLKEKWSKGTNEEAEARAKAFTTCAKQNCEDQDGTTLWGGVTCAQFGLSLGSKLCKMEVRYGLLAEECCPKTCGQCDESEQNAQDEAKCDVARGTSVRGTDLSKICSNAAQLDFKSVKQNNLDGKKNGARELRFGALLTKNDGTTDVDLVVTSDDYQSVRSFKNGKKGDFGKVNVQLGDTRRFKFSLLDATTGQETDPGDFVFNFFDIDGGKRYKEGESIEICDVTDVILTTNSVLEKTVTDSCVTVTNTKPPVRNPGFKNLLTDEQKSVAVGIVNPGSSFSVTLSSPTKKKRGSGRNFFFAASPTLACVCTQA